jgi:malonyl-CoA O-methyltransferase
MGFIEIVRPPDVVAAFDAAADTYADAAALQDEVAQELLRRAESAGQPRRILDMGCGAGGVTARLAARWPHAQIDALDAAPAMLAAMARRLPQARPICADAATFAPQESYDLIVSSMALHWLPDPRAALARWRGALAPGGALHVALPVAGSLDEWRAACAGVGACDGLWRFPAADFAEGVATHADMIAHRMIYPTARDFLASLKRTGSHSPRPGAAPLSAATLRRLYAQSPRPFAATYRILYLTA